jgi:hypothetical protein
LHLHAWLIGQPFCIGFLDEALGHMRRHQVCGQPVGCRLSTGTGDSARTNERASPWRCPCSAWHAAVHGRRALRSQRTSAGWLTIRACRVMPPLL